VKYLLDTHIWLWWLSDPDALADETVSAIGAPENLVVVSAASVWEVAIKRARGRLQFDGDPVEAVADGGFEPLPITLDHAAAAGSLPAHHRDPFDRMLVAQAQIEDLTVITRDPSFDVYDVRLRTA
jgi:PIN domain nuclease of toxin-antitoxin system